jgi:hypothetical protein
VIQQDCGQGGEEHEFDDLQNFVRRLDAEWMGATRQENNIGCFIAYVRGEGEASMMAQRCAGVR